MCGFLVYLREIDFKKFREIVDEVGVLLLGDIVYVVGFVVIGEYVNFFLYCYVVLSIIYKILRGFRGGFILINDEEIAVKIDKVIFLGI